MSVKELIAALEEVGGEKWKNAKSVTLHSCETGKGNNSIAQLLADLTGKNVIAPTDVLRTDGTIANGGIWKPFSPRKGDDLPEWENEFTKLATDENDEKDWNISIFNFNNIKPITRV